MATPAPNAPSSLPALRLLAAAPHRLLFCIGAANILLAMAWWALWLANTRWQLFAMPQPVVYAGWMHAIVMQYQVLPPFMFGFLLTVFPRWMGLPLLTKRHYVPVGLGLFGGQLLTLIGLFGHEHALHLGIVLTILGWAYGLFLLVRLLWREQVRTWHAVSCAFALLMGLTGLIAFAVYLHHPDPLLIFVAIKFGSFGLLLPIFFTVCHRMIPFFASVVVKGYTVWKPMWVLGVFWVLVLAHLAMELVHGYGWLWIADLPLAALGIMLLWKWWVLGPAPAILRVLFIAFAWLPIAMLLYSGQSLWFATTDVYALGRAPAHALFIGFFGSLLVAMVTRVTQGHAGRPMELGFVPGCTFVLLQVVVILRVVAEEMPDAMAWDVVAAVGWLVAFMPWVLRSAWIYLTPRRDGKPG